MFKFLFGLIGSLLSLLFAALSGVLKHIVLIFLIAIALLFIGVIATYTFGSPFAFLRKPVPINYEAFTRELSPVAPGSFKGSKYILFFASVKCGKCVAQVSQLREIGKSKEVDIYFIFPYKERNAVIKNLYIYQLAAMDVFFDTKNGSVASAFNAFLLPQTSVIDENGVDVLDIYGSLTSGDIRLISKALDAPATKLNSNNSGSNVQSSSQQSSAQRPTTEKLQQEGINNYKDELMQKNKREGMS